MKFAIIARGNAEKLYNTLKVSFGALRREAVSRIKVNYFVFGSGAFCLHGQFSKALLSENHQIAHVSIEFLSLNYNPAQ